MNDLIKRTDAIEYIKAILGSAKLFMILRWMKTEITKEDNNGSS